jgi:hypothetical protein
MGLLLAILSLSILLYSGLSQNILNVMGRINPVKYFVAIINKGRTDIRRTNF